MTAEMLNLQRCIQLRLLQSRSFKELVLCSSTGRHMVFGLAQDLGNGEPNPGVVRKLTLQTRTCEGSVGPMWKSVEVSSSTIDGYSMHPWPATIDKLKLGTGMQIAEGTLFEHANFPVRTLHLDLHKWQQGPPHQCDCPRRMPGVPPYHVLVTCDGDEDDVDGQRLFNYEAAYLPFASPTTSLEIQARVRRPFSGASRLNDWRALLFMLSRIINVWKWKSFDVSLVLPAGALPRQLLTQQVVSDQRQPYPLIRLFDDVCHLDLDAELQMFFDCGNYTRGSRIRITTADGVLERRNFFYDSDEKTR